MGDLRCRAGIPGYSIAFSASSFTLSRFPGPAPNANQYEDAFGQKRICPGPTYLSANGRFEARRYMDRSRIKVVKRKEYLRSTHWTFLRCPEYG